MKKIIGTITAMLFFSIVAFSQKGYPDHSRSGQGVYNPHPNVYSAREHTPVVHRYAYGQHRVIHHHVAVRKSTTHWHSTTYHSHAFRSRHANDGSNGTSNKRNRAYHS